MKNKYLKFVSLNHQKCIITPLSSFERLTSYKNDSGEICSLRFMFNVLNDYGDVLKIEIRDNCAQIQKAFEDFLVNDYIIFNCVCNF